MSTWRGNSFFLVSLIAVMVACSEVPTTPGSEPPPSPEINPIRLKEIVIPNLPSPYYHFEYDSIGQVKFVSFASDLTRYDVTYQQSRISEMRNNVLVNHDRLVYVYDDAGQVGIVKYLDSSDAIFTFVALSYDGPKLTGLERSRKVPGGYIIEKTMAFSYYPDGNLKQITEHRPPITGVQDEATYVDTFELYDTGINIDGFQLLHEDFSDHLVLLPEVQLQKGNPRRQSRSGDGLNFVVDYSYSYDDKNRPTSKAGDLLILNGPSAGTHVPTSSAFSYYP